MDQLDTRRLERTPFAFASPADLPDLSRCWKSSGRPSSIESSSEIELLIQRVPIARHSQVRNLHERRQVAPRCGSVSPLLDAIRLLQPPR